MQITNDPEFANSWAERKVLAAGLQDLGVSVQWVPVSRKPGDKKGSTRKSRHRISLLQLATKDEVLIMQMAHMQPSRVPDMVKEILSDRNVVKHGFRLLDSAIKIERDWDVRISPRVECSEYASSLRYLSKDACEVCASVTTSFKACQAGPASLFIGKVAGVHVD